MALTVPSRGYRRAGWAISETPAGLVLRALLDRMGALQRAAGLWREPELSYWEPHDTEGIHPIGGAKARGADGSSGIPASVNHHAQERSSFQCTAGTLPLDAAAERATLGRSDGRPDVSRSEHPTTEDPRLVIRGSRPPTPHSPVSITRAG